MKATVRNTELTPDFFERNFSRDELRKIARQEGILGANRKEKLARNIALGVGRKDYEAKTSNGILFRRKKIIFQMNVFYT